MPRPSFRRPPQDLTLSFRSLQASLDALHEHARLELREHHEYSKKSLASWGGGVNALLVKAKVRVLAVEFVQEGHEVLEAASYLRTEHSIFLISYNASVSD